MATEKKDKKSQIAHPHGPRAQFCGNTQPEFLDGTAERDSSLTGCCPYKNSAFEVTLCSGIVHIPI